MPKVLHEAVSCSWCIEISAAQPTASQTTAVDPCSTCSACGRIVARRTKPNLPNPATYKVQSSRLRLGIDPRTKGLSQSAQGATLRGERGGGRFTSGKEGRCWSRWLGSFVRVVLSEPHQASGSMTAAPSATTQRCLSYGWQSHPKSSSLRRNFSSCRQCIDLALLIGCWCTSRKFGRQHAIYHTPRIKRRSTSSASSTTSKSRLYLTSPTPYHSVCLFPPVISLKSMRSRGHFLCCS